MPVGRGSLGRVVFVFLFGCAVLLCGCGDWEVPPGVREGDGLFRTEVWYRWRWGGGEPDLAYTHLGLLAGGEVAVMGRAVHLVNPATREPIERIRPARPADFVFPGGAPADFYILGFDTIGGPTLMDKDGATLWEGLPSGVRVLDVTWGDLDLDGMPEVYPATDDGLYRLDATGNIVWQLSGHLMWQVAVLQPNWSDVPLVMTHSHENLLQFWNAEGKLLKEIQSPHSVTHISPIDWPTDGDLAVVRDGRDIAIVDTGSWRTVFTDRVYAGLGYVFGTSFAPFRPQRDSEPYLAVLVRYSASSQRSMLLVYSPSGDRVYKEILDRTTTSLCAVPHPNEDGTEFLLVGSGVGEVTAYHFTGKADG